MPKYLTDTVIVWYYIYRTSNHPTVSFVVLKGHVMKSLYLVRVKDNSLPMNPVGGYANPMVATAVMVAHSPEEAIRVLTHKTGSKWSLYCAETKLNFDVEDLGTVQFSQVGTEYAGVAGGVLLLKWFGPGSSPA